MAQNTDQIQRVNILRPYSEVLRWVQDSISPVAVQNVDPALAVGATFAEDIIASKDYPQSAVALHDGWAVESEQLTDASAYSPASLTTMPPWVNTGQPIPRPADSVLPVDAIAQVSGVVEVYATATPGEGISFAGSDVAKGDLLCEAGSRLQQAYATILRQLGFASVAIRLPKVKIVPLSASSAENDFIGPVVAQAFRAGGVEAQIVYGMSLEQVSSVSDCDAVITIGQTGSGNNDKAVNSLSRAGTLAFHGIGLTPGQTAAFGSLGSRPVLMLPGRLDAAVAVFLAVGNEIIKKLTGAKAKENRAALPLTKKVSSIIGLAEVVFVRRVSEGVMPLGSGVFPLQSILQADGWVLIPEASEGVPAGTNIEVRNLP